MNKQRLSNIQHYVECKSHYSKLLKERFLNQDLYRQTLLSIKEGLKILRIPLETMRAFEEKAHLAVWTGHRLPEYEGYEIALYIAHKKQNLPIPQGLREKCPDDIVHILEDLEPQKHIQQFKTELKNYSLSPAIFLAIHKCLLGVRTEKLLPNLLADIENSTFTSIQDALNKIPSVYLEYLSSPSLSKLIKKVSSLLHGVKSKIEQELKDIDLYSLRLKEQLNELYLEADKGLKDIIENDLVQGVELNVITQKTSNLFSRLDRLFLGNIYHLKDYEKRWNEIQQYMKQDEEFRYYPDNRIVNKRKKISELYNEYTFFYKFGDLAKDEIKIFMKVCTQEFEHIHRKKQPDVGLLSKYEKRGLLSVGIDFDAVQEAYHTFMQKIILRQQIAHSLLDLVQCLPPAANKPTRVVHDLAHVRTLALDGKAILSLKKDPEFDPDVKNYIETYRKCITVLMYDIRGSSYMGVKLQNAAKEQRIKYKFAKEMADIVKRYGGFLLKDTGDGGLIWFADNSASLYNHLYTESTTGRGIKLRYSIFSGAEFDLIPATDSAKRAILCARDMVQRAEEFIRANFMHYREWFADVAERTLELDGITYALLPPEFKSLFRIGIGIASGAPHKDVVFCANSYGDPDLIGPIIADANLYSRERQPGRSVVICDSSSLLNLILNVEHFDYQLQEENFEAYLKAVEEIKKKSHGYDFSDHNFKITPKGFHDLEELDKNKALKQKSIDEVYIKGGNIFGSNKRKIKPIYEVINT